MAISIKRSLKSFDNEKWSLGILRGHKKRFSGSRFVKVTTTRWYEIPAGTSEDAEDLITEWFLDTPISRSHAFRDGSLLIEHFNDDAKIADIKK
jgi:hypothetical protein